MLPLGCEKANIFGTKANVQPRLSEFIRIRHLVKLRCEIALSKSCTSTLLKVKNKNTRVKERFEIVLNTTKGKNKIYLWNVVEYVCYMLYNVEE